MEEEKMLAVRVAPELVDAVRDYAHTHKQPIRKVMEEIIRMGLEERSRHEYKSRREKAHMSYDDFVKARERGEIVYATQKKMLAVRIAPELVEAIRNFATTERENINSLLEEFIRLALARSKGEIIDVEDLAVIPHAPFRNRWERRKN